jgi:hypothetical protein
MEVGNPATGLPTVVNLIFGVSRLIIDQPNIQYLSPLR